MTSRVCLIVAISALITCTMTLHAQAAPGIDSINPAAAILGSAGFTLTVTGTNFVAGSVVCWNGLSRPTTFVSGTELTAEIPSTDLMALRSIEVSVCDGSGPLSNTAVFAIYRALGQVTKDILYDPFGRRIYASIPSSVPDGNSLTSFDPSIGIPAPAIPIGSDPNKLALSSNGEYLYVGLDGANAVRRLDLASQTPGLQFSLGLDENFHTTYYAGDIEVLPGNPDVVAVARQFVLVSPADGGVAIYDHGIKRATEVSHLTSSDRIAFSAAAPTLYGYDFSDSVVRVMSVNSSGIAVVNTVPSVLSGYDVDIEFDTNRLYSTSGKVIDPTTFSIVGTFTASDFVSPVAVVVDAAQDRVFFLSLSGTTALVHVFNRTTFALIGRINIPAAPGTLLSSLLRWGDAGLAFRSIDKIYTLEVPRAWLSPAASVSIAPVSLSYPVRSVGTTSAPATLTLSNNTGTPVTITSITASGDFAQTNNCGNGLDAFANCSINVTFAPAALGSRKGTLTIIGDSPDSPHVAGLSGIGDASLPVPSITSLAPNAAAAGAAGLTLTVTGTNFVAASVVRWNGQNRPTVFVNGNQLTATIAATDLAGIDTATVTVFTPAPDGGASNSLSFAIYRSLNLTTKDLIYDRFARRIYASIPSTAFGGNSIAAIDPFNVSVGNSVFVGSDPGKLALSDNGQYLYAGLDGAAAVRRVDLTTQTAGLQFSLGSDAFSGPTYPSDLEVLPGAPASIAVARYYPNFSPSYAGIAVYDDGIRRPANAADFNGSSSIEFSASSSIIYGAGDGFRTMTVDTNGVTRSNEDPPNFPGYGIDITYGGGKVYGDGGAVVDPVTTTLAGTFSPMGSSTAPVVDVPFDRVFFLSRTGTTAVIRVFNRSTFVFVGSIVIPISGNSIGSLVRWGDDGLVFRGNSNVYFLRIPRAWIASPPELTVSATSIVFPIQAVGTSSGPRSVTLTNNGNGTISIGGIVTSGDFTQTNDCGVSLAAHSSCAVDVTFTPGLQGSRGGSLTISDGSTMGPHIVGLTGIGDFLVPAPGLISIFPASTAAGSAGFTLSVNGASFVAGAEVRWNGQLRPTTFVSSNSLTAAISAGDVAQVGSATITVFNPGPGGGLSANVGFVIYRSLTLTANDLIYDRFGHRMYAAAAGSNSITPIDPFTETIGTPITAESEPKRLAISDNGQYLYFSLDGGNSIRKLDLASQIPGAKFSVGSGSFGPYIVRDMEVLPGNASAIAVSRTYQNLLPSFAGVVIYDDGVQRPKIAGTGLEGGVDVIEFSNSASSLYGLNYETTEFGFRLISVTASGATVTNTATQIRLGSDMSYENGMMYGTSGLVIEPVSGAIAGKFNLPSTPSASWVVSDSSLDRTFFLYVIGSTALIQIFNRTDLTLVGSLTITGTGSLTKLTRLVRWGDDGLAFGTSAGQVFLLRIPRAWLPAQAKRRSQVTSQ